MTTFRCAKFPNGNIRTTAGIVPFRGGLAVVDDPEVAQALREVPEVFGVAEVTAAAAPETCPVCGARQDIPAPPPAPPVEPVKSTEDTGTGDSGAQQSTPDSGAGDHGQGDTGDEDQGDDGDTAPVVLERPAESATRGDWLVYVAAVLGKPQSAFKGKKLDELKALVPAPE